MGLTTRKMQKTRKQSPAGLNLNYSEDNRECRLMSAYAKRIDFTNSYKYLVKDHNGHEHSIDYLNYHGFDCDGILVEQKTGMRKEMHFFSNNTPGIIY